MDGKAVLDSSVVVALFFREDASERAEEVVMRFPERYTVSQIYSEVANAAWKRVRIYGEDAALVRRALEKAIDFVDGVCEVVDAKKVLSAAFDLAISCGVTVYDALFLALAVELEAKLITLDRELCKTLKGTKYEKRVELV
ncbi:type II toxin-antitoxin system VapC family toxin [Archaeoglobus neptunius]|uniref:type II toxin-antitoxin system VapC family toxin n=1 Tax=Archaeoglobus neptunius TaxID=2798580 RepID=UPI00192971EB|nr:type II toxin-antitoxin system VapC family toxin [Archaeoglobus neptunius]